MTNTKTTKSALLASILSLVICLSMLAGTTFAWFTDSATTGVGSIVSGTLDIDLVDAEGNSLEGKTVGFKDLDKNGLWEPGCRYTLETVKLVNNGNLHAKYKVVITATTGDVDLAEVIDVYEGETKLGTLRDFLNMKDGIKEGVIAPKETLAFGTLTLVMQENAGNDYQGKSITGITITVVATQATVESDSFGNQYDAGAKYPTEKATVANDTELAAAIEAKADYNVGEGSYSKVVVADAVNVTIDGGSFSNQIVAARNGATVTVKNATGRTGSSGQNVIASVNSGSTVIFEGGNYPLFNTLLYGDGTGTVIITGGYFDGACFYWSIGGKPVANLTITGGTFGPNFMFMAGMMGPSIADFVPDTHQIINNEDGSCTVVAK